MILENMSFLVKKDAEMGTCGKGVPASRRKAIRRLLAPDQELQLLQRDVLAFLVVDRALQSPVAVEEDD